VSHQSSVRGVPVHIGINLFIDSPEPSASPELAPTTLITSIVVIFLFDACLSGLWLNNTRRRD
jgi:hypothetical protein